MAYGECPLAQQSHFENPPAHVVYYGVEGLYCHGTDVQGNVPEQVYVKVLQYHFSLYVPLLRARPLFARSVNRETVNCETVNCELCTVKL
jgi:hypothetical protein